ncbi:Low affinity Fe/Cu permease [Actinokineospora alba]|uniref:Low affinity Fe/Cu permease n=1 Tax=Actinokineospora alba TaxID=504798 RepID=A0A1H0TSW3_9PSEU|nr:low affinity iron permease family protein [Actinokineospora alba]TDP70701.1 low affinity Fe/Cu permease [Actinokineospora alba]SDJ14089.1 Low affinity Fe/Cu permease [Actinokineospora alba]SDP57172.1 Low affinity Fe/Cu permease [Actinokineospora alba]
MSTRHIREAFSTTAEVLAKVAGSPWTSGLGVLTVLTLLIAGVSTGFADTWQLVVYSAGSLVSLLVLFSIQHTTNRQTNAILLKLDELVRATEGAHDELIAIEDRELHEQEQLHDLQRQGELRPTAVPAEDAGKSR